MSFFESFLRAGIVTFSFTLVGSWVVQLIGEPSGSNYKDKGHNILIFIIFGVLMFAVFGMCSQISNPILGLLPALLVIIAASVYRLSYEKNYELAWFYKSFSVKIGLALFAAFMMSSGK